jgi:transcriptional/translational regulatory protein YebC/TACO1|tara:strand:- start:43873 stop:44394 length:522 start_codon:yes stop_codon:yes gene_type:complete
MKEVKSEIEEEKSMYLISFGILLISFVTILGLSSGIAPLFQNSITGAVTHGGDLESILSEVDYEDIGTKFLDYDNINTTDVSQQTALNALLQAELDLEEMKQQNFGITWVNDSIIEAKKHFEGADYSNLIAELEFIPDIEQKEKSKELLLKAQETIGVAVDYNKVVEITKMIS